MGTCDCENYFSSGVLKTLEGSTHSLTLNVETIFSVTEKGLIHDSSSSVTCKEEQMQIGHEIVDDILQLSQYKVIIFPECLLADKYSGNYNQIPVNLVATSDKPPSSSLSQWPPHLLNNFRPYLKQ